MTPQNLVAAAVLAQFILIVILVITCMCMDGFNIGGYSDVLLFATLTTFGVFLFSDVFIELWKPLFSNRVFDGLAWRTAVSVMFIVDALCITLLVAVSGGSRHSPLVGGFALIPTLSLFLREPVGWTIFYTALVIVGITVTRSARPERGGDLRVISQSGAFWFMNVASLALVTFIGIITSPG